MCMTWCGCSLDVDLGGRGAGCSALGAFGEKEMEPTGSSICLGVKFKFFVSFVYIFSFFWFRILRFLFLSFFCKMHEHLGGKCKK